MPDRQEARRACYTVMAQHSYEGITRGRVAKAMRAKGISPGSNRDLGTIIDEFEEDVSRIATTLPGVIQDKLTTLVQDDATAVARDKLFEVATEIWHYAFAAGLAVPGFFGSGRESEERPPPRPRLPRPTLSNRLANLRNVVERMLSADVPVPIRAPITPAEIFRRLGKTHQSLTDANHISRDLEKLDSHVLYKTPNKHWWRRDRPLPGGFGEEKLRKRTPRTNSALSLKRQVNEPSFDRAISFLISEGRAMKTEAIAKALQIPEEEAWAFGQMLRNRLRGKNPLLSRDDEGKYFVVDQRQR